MNKDEGKKMNWNYMIHMDVEDEGILCTRFCSSTDQLIDVGVQPRGMMMDGIRVLDKHGHHSERWSKNTKPEFSRINDGGSTSVSTCFIDLEMSSTVKGMLHRYLKNKRGYKLCLDKNRN